MKNKPSRPYDEALPRVSVIIPVFNDADGLRCCIASIAGQTYPLDFVEIIVIDNGSDIPVTVEADSLVSIRVINCSTPGAYAARNAGVRVAAGDIFAFTDADCVVDKVWLERGVRAFQEGDGNTVFGGDVRFFHSEHPTAVELYQLMVGFGQERNIEGKGFSATANLFCTCERFHNIGSFDENLFSGGDREWAWRGIAKCGLAIRYEPEAVVYTRPRASLHAAIQQARRIVGGREALRKYGLAYLGLEGVAKNRTAWQSVCWIMMNRELRVWGRVRVLSVAVVVWAVAAAEKLRLALGAYPERR